MNAERIAELRGWLQAKVDFQPSMSDIEARNDLLALLAAEESRLTWTPTAENINALPETIRNYIHGIEALCDPAGIVRENVLVNDINAGLLRDRESRLTAPAGTDDERAEIVIAWLRADKRDLQTENIALQAGYDAMRAELEKVKGAMAEAIRCADSRQPLLGIRIIRAALTPVSGNPAGPAGEGR